MEECRIFTVCESKRDAYAHAKDYQDKAVRLVRSLRKNGGNCRDFPVTAWYGKDALPDTKTFEQLRFLGCDFYEGECEYKDKPLFNKISAINTPFEEKYGMWMDSDIFVLGDFSSLIFDNQVDVAAPDNCYEFHKWVREEDTPTWERYYDRFGIEKPVPRMPTCLDNGEGNFYFNSAIILFRNGIKFPELYQETAHAMLRTDEPERELNFTQTSLSLTTLRGKYSWKVIPEWFHSYYVLRDKKLMPDTILSHYQDNRITEVLDEDWNV